MSWSPCAFLLSTKPKEMKEHIYQSPLKNVHGNHIDNWSKHYKCHPKENPDSSWWDTKSDLRLDDRYTWHTDISKQYGTKPTRNNNENPNNKNDHTKELLLTDLRSWNVEKKWLQRIQSISGIMNSSTVCPEYTCFPKFPEQNTSYVCFILMYI